MKKIFPILALLCFAFPLAAADNPNVAGKRVISAYNGSGIQTALTNANLNGSLNATNVEDFFFYDPTDGDVSTMRWLFGANNGSTYSWEHQVSTNEFVFRSRVGGLAQVPFRMTRGGGVTITPATGHSTSNNGPFRVTGDVTALGDAYLTDTLQFGTAGGGSTIGHYQENDWLIVSNQMQGSSFYLSDRLYDGAGVAYALSTEVGGGGSSFGVYSNSTKISTNPVALIFSETPSVTPTVSSNGSGTTITMTVNSNLALNSLTLTGSGGYIWSGLGTNAVVSNTTNFVFDFANGDAQWMVPAGNVNFMFATNGSTNTLYGKSASATLTVDLRGKAFECRLSFPTGWYRIGVATTNNALLTTNTLNKIALEGTDAAANTIVTNTSLATGYGQ